MDVVPRDWKADKEKQGKDITNWYPDGERHRKMRGRKTLDRNPSKLMTMAAATRSTSLQLQPSHLDRPAS